MIYLMWTARILYPLWIATLAAMIGLTGFGVGRAWPHDVWANGDKVPAWVATSCCGQADAHVLGPDDYFIDSAGFHVKGIGMTVPLDKVLPSQDGKVWAFYPSGVGENAKIYCVFYSGSI